MQCEGTALKGYHAPKPASKRQMCLVCGNAGGFSGHAGTIRRPLGFPDIAHSPGTSMFSLARGICDIGTRKTAGPASLVRSKVECRMFVFMITTYLTLPLPPQQCVHTALHFHPHFSHTSSSVLRKVVCNRLFRPLTSHIHPLSDQTPDYHRRRNLCNS